MSTGCSRWPFTAVDLARGESDQRHLDALNSVGADGTATFILGGQIAGRIPAILLVYSEGNYIRASNDRPFLQIGESKYGSSSSKWRSSRARLSIEDRHRIDDEHSTGQFTGRPTLRFGHLPSNGLTVEEFRILPDSAVLGRLQTIWQRHMLQDPLRSDNDQGCDALGFSRRHVV